MHDHSSIESSVGKIGESELHKHFFDYDTDCESIESSRSWNKSSGGHQCDVSIESPWRLLEDHDHFSSHNSSDEELEEENCSIHHDVLPVVCQQLATGGTITISSMSNVPMADAREPNKVVSSLGTTNSILCETDSLLFHRPTPVIRDEECPMMKRHQRTSGKHAQGRLHRHRVVKEHIPQFAVIEWDDEMLKKQETEGVDSSSDDGEGSRGAKHEDSSQPTNFM